MIIGPLTGGWLGDHFGIRIIYLVAAGLFILSTVLVTRIQAQPRDVQSADAPPPGLLKNRRYLGFLGLAFGVAFATYLAQPLTPNFLQNERGLSLSQIGLLGGSGRDRQRDPQPAARPAQSPQRIPAGPSLRFALQPADLARERDGLLWIGLLPARRISGRAFAGGCPDQAFNPRVANGAGLWHGRYSPQFDDGDGPLLAGFLYQTRPEMVYPLAMAVLLIVILASFIFAPREEVSNMPLEQT